MSQAAGRARRGGGHVDTPSPPGRVLARGPPFHAEHLLRAGRQAGHRAVMVGDAEQSNPSCRGSGGPVVREASEQTCFLQVAPMCWCPPPSARGCESQDGDCPRHGQEAHGGGGRGGQGGGRAPGTEDGASGPAGPCPASEFGLRNEDKVFEAKQMRSSVLRWFRRSPRLPPAGGGRGRPLGGPGRLLGVRV